jgi:hypothetical protein
MTRWLVRGTLAFGPFFFSYWLIERGIVPARFLPFLAIGSLIAGAWLATAAFEDVLRDYMRQRLGHEQATRTDAGET